MYKSTDGGFSFPNDIGNTIHVDQHVLAFAPGNANTIYVGNDGGLFVSKAGAAFVSLNTGLVITQFYPGLALNGSVAMGGTQDNGTNFTTAAKDQSPYLDAAVRRRRRFCGDRAHHPTRHRLRRDPVGRKFRIFRSAQIHQHRGEHVLSRDHRNQLG